MPSGRLLPLPLAAMVPSLLLAQLPRPRLLLPGLHLLPPPPHLPRALQRQRRLLPPPLPVRRLLLPQLPNRLQPPR